MKKKKKGMMAMKHKEKIEEIFIQYFHKIGIYYSYGIILSFYHTYNRILLSFTKGGEINGTILNKASYRRTCLFLW